MTQREKILSAIVALIVAVLGTLWLINNIMDAFDARHERVAELQQQVAAQEGKIRRGKIALAELKTFERESLPSDLSRAKTQYRVWLHELTKKAGMQANVTLSGERRAGKDLYIQHGFQVQGEADLDKLIRFLHEFYSAGYFHRVSSLNLEPIKDKKELEVTMAIDALSLGKAPEIVEGGPPPARRPPGKSRDQYAQTILARNFFSPGNNPPSIASPGTQRGNPNRPLSFTVKATDPDKLDKLTYALESPQLEGAKIDSKTGEFRMTPGKIGEYEVVVRVTDDGFPPKSAVEKIKIAVADAPAIAKEDPFLKDDPARDAKVTGTVSSSDKLQVWVTVPRGLGDQPRTLHLTVGDSISVGSFVGKVRQIRVREAEFELKDGRTVVVQSGQPLVPSPNSAGG